MQQDIIGNYRVVQKIGAGGMAKVYLAVHVDIPNLKVILKILEDPQLVDRFRQEADKLALLDGNSKICQIKHFFAHGDEFVIAMEYIDGVSLDQTVKELGRLPLGEAVRIMCEVLDVLDFAHSKEIYHRDIKPSNIMIDKRGMVKVIDFGIAKGKSDPDLTIAGTACGTPSYMAPEQFTPTPSTNYGVIDIYAAGTTLFNLVTGDLPFKADNEFLLRDAKLFNEPVSPRSLNPEIPKALEEVILKSLKRTPTERYMTAAAMKKALEAVPLPRDSGSHHEKTVAIGTSTEKKTDSRSRAGMFVGIAAAIVIVGVGAYWMLGGKSEPAGNVPSSIPSGDSLHTAQATDTQKQVTEPAQVAQDQPRTATTAEQNSNRQTVENSRPQTTTTGESPKPVTVEPVKQQPVGSAEVRIGSGSYPGARIYINGKLQDEVTPYAFKLTPGEYRIEVKTEIDGQAASRDTTLTIAAGDAVRVNLKFDQ